MTNGNKLVFAALTFAALVPSAARAMPAAGPGAAPELFGVREVIVDYAHFDDPKAADTCGITREKVAAVLAKALNGSGVPAIPVTEARPPAMGVARISLLPVISSHVDDNLGCISWISLTAESHSNAVIPPVGTLRSVTIVYWRQHVKVASSESLHGQEAADVLAKMADQFAQQFRLDQPPEGAQ